MDSSNYNSFLGRSKNRFDQTAHRKTQSINEPAFFQWTSGHMYRTSYNDMSNKGKSVEKKNSVIPKYQGYRPSLAADSHLQKTFTEQSRDVFIRSKLDDQKQMISSTGFNKVHIPKTDDTLNSTIRRYGTETAPQTHPNNHSKHPVNETTFRNSYINPKRHSSAVWRDRNPSRAFSGEKTIKFHEHIQDKTNLDGQR